MTFLRPATAVIFFWALFLAPASLSAGDVKTNLSLSNDTSSDESMGFQTIFPLDLDLKQTDRLPPVLVLKPTTVPKITARRALVVDVISGEILYTKNSETPAPVASLTKLMTGLVAWPLLSDLDSIVNITAADARAGNLVYLTPGDQATVRDLYTLALVASSNEAAVALAGATGLSAEAFASLMNDRVFQLGLQKTFFVDASGLLSANFATAVAVQKIFSEAMKIPSMADIVGVPQATFMVQNSGRAKNIYPTHTLFQSFLNDHDLDFRLVGIKTGFIEESLYCLAARVAHAGRQIDVVLLGSQTNALREQEVKDLVSWTFENFIWPGDSPTGA